MLDSKREPDQAVIAGAPTIGDFRGAESSAHFDIVVDGLRALDIPFAVEPKLVRGLDYYRRTIFEFQGGTLDSAQNALGGGGRYDGLVEALGGPATPGVGFALGLDRTLLACDDEGVFGAAERPLDAFVVDVVGGRQATVLTAALRNAGLTADRGYDNRSMKAQMKLANRSGAAFAVIVGDDELAAGHVVVKPLRTTADQVTIDRDDLVDHLDIPPNRNRLMTTTNDTGHTATHVDAHRPVRQPPPVEHRTDRQRLRVGGPPPRAR